MSRSLPWRTGATITVIAAACAAPLAIAQTTTTTPSTPSTRAETGVARLASGDRKFVEDAAKGGMAEVELGKLAQQKATNPQVKEFAARMVADHGKANDELKQLAQAKGVTLPTAIDGSMKRDADKLSKASGADFDREYMKHMLSDHKKDVSMFRKTAEGSKDADLKAFAGKTLPTLEEHLRMAQATESAMKAR